MLIRRCSRASSAPPAFTLFICVLIVTKLIKPASTVCLVRTADSGLEVLLMRRRMGGTFSGLHVFPGGVVDAQDNHVATSTHTRTMQVLAKQQQFAGPHHAHAYWVAAVREAFEESGLLLAYDDEGRFVGGDCDAFAAERELLNAKQISFNDFLTEHQLSVAFDQLTYIGRRVTPAFAPARFDTHFFLSVLPDNVEGTPCNQELETCFWISPTQALARAKVDIEMIYPTLKTLEALIPFACAADAFAHFEQQWVDHVATPRPA